MDILEIGLALVVVALVFVLFFTNKISSLELEWPNAPFPTIRLTATEVKSEFQGLYKDMMKSAEDFRNHMREPKYERDVVQAILDEEQFQLPEEFERLSDLHDTLRSLRTAGLIRPYGGGEWAKRKTVEKTLFCRKLLEQLGERRTELWSPTGDLTGSETD